MHAQTWELQDGGFGAARPHKCASIPWSGRRTMAHHHRSIGKSRLPCRHSPEDTEERESERDMRSLIFMLPSVLLHEDSLTCVSVADLAYVF